MMEVKRSPTVTLLDYGGSTNNESNGADITNSMLKNTNATKRVPAKNPKNDDLEDDLEFHDAVDDGFAINSDLEDALLADGDLQMDGESKATKNDLDSLEKAENSTDLGDDLDKLLSKINEVVEGSNSMENGTKVDEMATKDSKVIIDSKVTDVKKNEKNIQKAEDSAKNQELMDVDNNKDNTNDSSVEMIEEEDVVMKENQKTDEAEAEKAVTQIGTAALKETTPVTTANNKESEQELPDKANENLEDGEIVDDIDETKDTNLEDGEIQDEIFTLVLDDDDDDDDVIAIEPEKPAKTLNTRDKKINNDQEIVCLDDDEEECLPTASENVEKLVEKSAKEEAVKSLNNNDDKVEELEIDSTVVAVAQKDATVAENQQHETENVIKTDEEKSEENEETVKSTKQPPINASAITEDDSTTSLKNKDLHQTDLDKDLPTELELKETTTETRKNDEAAIVLVDKDAETVESESKEVANVDKPEQIVENESRGCESASEAPTETETSTIQGGDIDEQKENPLKTNDLIADNTDNACDGSEGSKTEKEVVEDSMLTAQTEDDAESLASSSSNLLQEGQAPRESAFNAAENEAEEDAEDCEADENDNVDLMVIETQNETEKAKPDLTDLTEDGADLETPPAKRLRLSIDGADDKKDEEEPENGEKVDTVDEPAQNTETQEENSNDSNEMQIVLEDESMDESKTDKTTTKTKTTFKRPFVASVEDAASKVNETDVETSSEESQALKKPKTNEDHKETAETGVLASETATKIEEQKEDEVKTNDQAVQQSTKTESKVCTDNIKSERISAVASNKPIPLYPPPKFEEEPKKLELDFLQRFRKTFNQMTKNDLEELVLQKVVEALVHENQFADLRLIIEKQEKVIALHRTKLAQLVKQYRDLEMVHTRVVKDMREKNSQYLMPVRITRAVGLQVSFPTIRRDGTVAQVAPNVASGQQLSGISPPTASASTTMRGPSNMLTQQLQQQQQQQIQKRLTSPQRPQQQVNANSQMKSPTVTTTATTTQPVRRGCMQKVTAQRPVHNGNASVSSNLPTTAATTINPPMASIPSSSFSRPSLTKPTTSPAATAADALSAGNPSRILNKLAQPVTSSRTRYSSGNANSTSPTQQQTTNSSQALNRSHSAVNNAGKINEAVKNKLSQQQQQQQFRRSDSSPTISTPNANKANTATSVYMEQYKNSFSQAMPNNVSITPARPKEKSVIDLTDEDDVPMQSTPQPSSAPPTLSSRTRQQPSQQTPTNTNNRQNAPPALTRMPSSLSVRPQITPRHLSSMQNPKSNNQQQSATITTTNNMSITRISVNQANPASQRVRYGHPAPLPATPPQQFNPGWKLPPPRPTIRISNLDNGIVISWTMDEPLDSHADVTTYQIYAYQETNASPSTDSWRHVGDVKAMLLPMAVTLTQFQEDQRYFFSVRAMDMHQRYGPFSAPKTWT